jgi:hypothetical protein
VQRGGSLTTPTNGSLLLAPAAVFQAGQRAARSQKDGLPTRCWFRAFRFKAIDARRGRLRVAPCARTDRVWRLVPGLLAVEALLCAGWMVDRRAIVASRRLVIG